jgi:hypothetical protein
MIRFLLAGFLGLIVSQEVVAQEASTGPACTLAEMPQPSSDGLGLKIDILETEDIAVWTPPACTGWKKRPFDFLIRVAARFRHAGSADDIARRLARFQDLTTIKYWSVSNQAWRQLFSDATGLAGADVDGPRAAFTVTDIRTGRAIHFMQDENNPLGPVAFRIDVRDRTDNRLSFNSTNISAFPVLFLDVVKPGGFQSYYLIERETGDIWRYAALVRSKIEHAFMAPSVASSKNRAQAYFRYLAGIRTDKEAPAAKE